jgi:hypothetical protein
MNIALAVVAVVQAIAIVVLLRDATRERRELLNRIKPETAQPHPGKDDPDPLPVDLEHDEHYNQHLEELEGR